MNDGRVTLDATLDRLVADRALTRLEALVLRESLSRGRGEGAWDESACRRIFGRVRALRPEAAAANALIVADALASVTAARWLAEPLRAFVSDLAAAHDEMALAVPPARLDYAKAVFCACLVHRNPIPVARPLPFRATTTCPPLPTSPSPVVRPRC